MHSLDIYFIEALLINATQINRLEKRTKEGITGKGGNFLAPLLESKELPLAEVGITPREDYIRNRIVKKENQESIGKLGNYLAQFSSFDGIGVETTIEFKDGALLQTLIKFQFDDVKKRDDLINKIEDKKKLYELIAISYKPVRDPLTVMCITMVKELVELEVLLDELKEYYRKAEFHIIFHQKYYSKAIEQHIRCKPCFYPLVPEITVDCPKKNCDKCGSNENCIKQNCGNCIRYILPRQMDRRLHIDFKPEKIKQNIMISLVSLDMGLSQFFALENSLDQKETRNNVFENYKNFLDTLNPGAKNLHESHENVLTKYKEIGDREEYRNRYKEAVIGMLTYLLGFRDPGIIIFPEYTIPLYIFNEIKSLPIEQECVIVAGSYIDSNKFNVCPIIFNRASEKGYEKQIYHYYKNNLTQIEECLGLVENKGTAYLKFLNTAWGNLYVQVCYDVHRIGRKDEFGNVDILLVPSYNRNSDFQDYMKNKAKEYKLVVAYANTINEGKYKSKFYPPPREGLDSALIDLKPLHKDQRPQGKRATDERLFSYSTVTQGEDGREDFNIKVKQLRFDLLQLDMRRGTNFRSKHEKKTAKNRTT